MWWRWQPKSALPFASVCLLILSNAVSEEMTTGPPVVAGGDPEAPVSPCAPLHRVAIMLAGHSSPKAFDRHMELLNERIVEYHAADVLASADFSDSTASLKLGLPLYRAVPAILGKRLKVLAISEELAYIADDGVKRFSMQKQGRARDPAQRVQKQPWQRVPLVVPPGGSNATLHKRMVHPIASGGGTQTIGAAVRELQASLEGTRVVAAPPPRVPNGWNIQFPGLWQWSRLSYLWSLLEEEETRVQKEFDIVLRLRYDHTPLPTIDLCGTFSDALPDLPRKPNSASLHSSFRALHLCTDHAFYGLRSEMKVACNTWSGIWSKFYGTSCKDLKTCNVSDVVSWRTKRSWERVVQVAPLIESYGNVPPPAVTRKATRGLSHYNKLYWTPTVELANTSSFYLKDPGKNVPKSLQAVLDSGVSVVDPAQQNDDRARLIPGPSDRGVMTGPFGSEKDLLVWLMAYNGITVCDLGGGVSELLYKGAILQRPSVSCRTRLGRNAGGRAETTRMSNPFPELFIKSAPRQQPSTPTVATNYSSSQGQQRWPEDTCLQQCSILPSTTACKNAHSPHAHFQPSGNQRSENTLRVRIWQAPGLQFMYSPATSSIRRILKVSTSRSISVDFQVCWPCNFNGVQRGDLFIWVGCIHREAIPFDQLAARGVYTVYYQTEPLWNFLPDLFLSNRPKPPGIPSGVHEVWDYSQKNVELLKARLKKPLPSPSAVPPLPSYVPVNMDPAAPVMRHGDSPPSSLIFIGNTQARRRKWGSLMADERVAPYLVSVQNIWNSTAYEALLARPGASIFLNLHKSSSDALEGFRVSELISRGAIVLSERSFAGDEEAYADLVDFADLNVNEPLGPWNPNLPPERPNAAKGSNGATAIADAFVRLQRLSGAERQTIANRRRHLFQERLGACKFIEVGRKALCQAWCNTLPTRTFQEVKIVQPQQQWNHPQRQQQTFQQNAYWSTNKDQHLHPRQHQVQRQRQRQRQRQHQRQHQQRKYQYSSASDSTAQIGQRSQSDGMDAGFRPQHTPGGVRPGARTGLRTPYSEQPLTSTSLDPPQSHTFEGAVKSCPLPENLSQDSFVLYTRALFEQPYLRGFIDWYSTLGVGCFVIIHTDDRKFPESVTTDKRVVVLSQPPAINDRGDPMHPERLFGYFSPFVLAQNYTWVLTVDIDEYLVLNHYQSLAAYARELASGVDCVQFFWAYREFLQAQCSSKPVSSVLLGHLREDDLGKVKSMARTKSIRFLDHPHMPILKPGNRVVMYAGESKQLNVEEDTARCEGCRFPQLQAALPLEPYHTKMPKENYYKDSVLVHVETRSLSNMLTKALSTKLGDKRIRNGGVGLKRFMESRISGTTGSPRYESAQLYEEFAGVLGRKASLPLVNMKCKNATHCIKEQPQHILAVKKWIEARTGEDVDFCARDEEAAILSAALQTKDITIKDGSAWLSLMVDLESVLADELK